MSAQTTKKAPRVRLEVGHTALPKGHILSPNGGLTTFAPQPPSALLARLQQFLPQIQQANAQLSTAPPPVLEPVEVTAADAAAADAAAGADGGATGSGQRSVEMDLYFHAVGQGGAAEDKVSLFKAAAAAATAAKAEGEDADSPSTKAKQDKGSRRNKPKKKKRPLIEELPPQPPATSVATTAAAASAAAADATAAATATATSATKRSGSVDAGKTVGAPRDGTHVSLAAEGGV